MLVHSRGTRTRNRTHPHAHARTHTRTHRGLNGGGASYLHHAHACIRTSQRVHQAEARIKRDKSNATLRELNLSRMDYHGFTLERPPFDQVPTPAARAARAAHYTVV